MITKFNTGSVSSVTPNAKGGSNTLLYIVLGAVAVYLSYKYVIKPQMEKQESEKQA